MYKTIDLSKAVPRNTIAITFRYEITGGAEAGVPGAWLADNVYGENPIRLAGRCGHVTVRLQTSQRLYYDLANFDSHLNLWIVESRELGKQAC